MRTTTDYGEKIKPFVRTIHNQSKFSRCHERCGQDGAPLGKNQNNHEAMSTPPLSDTPRTDAESKRIKLDPDIGSERQTMAIFARKLERELTEAKKDAEALYKELSKVTEHVCECDEAKLLACDDYYDIHPPSTFSLYAKAAMPVLSKHERIAALPTKKTKHEPHSQIQRFPH